jgi:hypothetical protein
MKKQPRRPLSTSDLIIGRDAHVVVRKQTRSVDTHGTDFVLSDESEDRMGDVIRSDGWILNQFKRNPIALFQHRSDFPYRLALALEPVTNAHAAQPDGATNPVQQLELRGHYRIGLRSAMSR